MPGVVAEETLGLVSRAHGERGELEGLVEEDDHPLARGHVAPPVSAGLGLELVEVTVHGARDVDRAGRDPELLRHEQGVLAAPGARSPVGQQEGEHRFRAESFRAQRRGQGRIHPSRQPDDDPAEAAPALDLLAEELNEPGPHEIGVDVERAGIRRIRSAGHGDARRRPRAGHSPSGAGRRTPDPGLFTRRRVQDRSRSEKSGSSVRARAASSRSTRTGSSASSHSGPARSRCPRGS